VKKRNAAALHGFCATGSTWGAGWPTFIVPRRAAEPRNGGWPGRRSEDLMHQLAEIAGHTGQLARVPSCRLVALADDPDMAGPGLATPHLKHQLGHLLAEWAEARHQR
jgi:hypothetical protein